MEISDELLGEEDFNILYDEEIVDMVIDMSQTYNLNVISNVDIGSHIFNMERRESEDEVTINQK